MSDKGREKRFECESKSISKKEFSENRVVLTDYKRINYSGVASVSNPMDFDATQVAAGHMVPNQTIEIKKT
jgi:hypothetical protein